MGLARITGSEMLTLTSIIIECLNVEGSRARIAYTSEIPFIASLASALEAEVSDLQRADIVFSDARTLTNDLLKHVVERLSSNSLIMVFGIVINIAEKPEVLKELSFAGLAKSFLPIDGGVAMCIKRGYDTAFLRKTVEVYRESFIHGPNPVDYNTALVLYILAKFLTTRRRGVIVEIGTGRGFSTLWLAHAAKETNSHVISIDNRCERVEYARNALKSLDLEKYADVLCIDAKSYTHGDKDVVYVFIDGKKDEYHKYLEALEPYLLPGALLLAHNTLSDAHLIKPYIKKVYTEPYKSITIATDPKGLTITVNTYH